MITKSKTYLFISGPPFPKSQPHISYLEAYDDFLSLQAIPAYLLAFVRHFSENNSEIRPLFSPEITEDGATEGARVGSGSGAQV
jgi:hypothetical protein